jgi:hypothetical protein
MTERKTLGLKDSAETEPNLNKKGRGASRFFALAIGALAISACDSNAMGAESELFADQIAQMEPQLRCMESVKLDRTRDQTKASEECLDLADANAALGSLEHDDPEALRFRAWMAWQQAQGIEAAGHKQLPYSVWVEAADFAKCIEANAIADAGFVSGDTQLYRASLSSAYEACSDHSLSMQGMIGKPLDVSNSEVRAKMLANSLSRMAILAALSSNDACPVPEPTCVPSPQSSQRANAPTPMPQPAPAARKNDD